MVKTTGYRKPAQMLLAQDSAEQRMEGDDDSIGLFPGQTEILRQWRYGLAPLYPGTDFTWEWYRHNKSSGLLWADGHVNNTRFRGVKVGIDYRFYVNEEPQIPLP
jgi:prepilin-type processing-associated H-X9-DG protein